MRHLKKDRPYGSQAIISEHDDSLVILGYGRHKDEAVSTIYLDFTLFEVRDHSSNILYTLVDNILSAPACFLPQPLRFRNNGELLLQHTCPNYDILSHNIKANKFKKFGLARGRRILCAIPFVETIALLNDADATFKYKELHEI